MEHKRLAALTVALLAMFISPAQAAIKIETAILQNDLAYIKGLGATPNALITWQGSAVTAANKNNGGFSFYGALPASCTGTLTDGTSTIQVTVLSCTPDTARVKVFVSAWSIDQTGAPRLIAQLEDTNGDGIVSVGDTVRTSEYPLDVSGTNYESFTTKTHEVTLVEQADNYAVVVYGGSSPSLSSFTWDSSRLDVLDRAGYSECAYSAVGTCLGDNLFHIRRTAVLSGATVLWYGGLEIASGSPSGPQTDSQEFFGISNSTVFQLLDLVHVTLDLSPP